MDMTTDTKAVTMYPKHCPIQLDRDGGYYSRHVAAMTEESLHRKSDIAAQLGARDRGLDSLLADHEQAVSVLNSVIDQRDAVGAECLQLEGVIQALQTELVLKSAEAQRLRDALSSIANLDPTVDSDEGFNEWGCADCFGQAQRIAKNAITEKSNDPSEA
jgi:hypothetical protein